MAHRGMAASAWLSAKSLPSCCSPQGLTASRQPRKRVLMPGQDDTNAPADRAREDGKEQPRLSRRSMLRGAAGAGVAGIPATALAGTARPAFAAASGPAHDPKDRVQDTDPAEQV